jgi:hypothetical protein
MESEISQIILMKELRKDSITADKKVPTPKQTHFGSKRIC